MAKIPQGEWNAIAARYAKGESLSKIAQSYSCTPPAIHYILKRSKQNAAEKFEQPLSGRRGPPRAIARQSAQTPAALDRSRSTEPRRKAPGSMRSRPDESLATAGAPNALRVVLDDRRAATHTPTLHDLSQPALPQQLPQSAPNAGRGSASTAKLDRELYGRVETAIEAFRLSFDAALAEGSLVTRQRLRQAASDLMRVAAQTTIVLDRLNARTERSLCG
jgi:hypothetical protein